VDVPALQRRLQADGVFLGEPEETLKSRATA
jgi:hypothetical protein